MLDSTEALDLAVHGAAQRELAIKLFKSYPKLRAKPYWGNHFWARGYFVTTVGIDEEVIRRYVRHQEDKERQEERERKGYDLFSDASKTRP